MMRREGRVPVAGATLPYAEQGAGAPLVLLHGALTDHAMWYPHMRKLSERFHVIAPTQRYFGDDPWQLQWPPFGVETHAQDLVAMLQALQCGPAHLVAWSYAGHVALLVALRHPELVASVYVYEPGVPSYVRGPADLAAFAQDAQAMFGPVFEAVQARGDQPDGVRCLIDASGGPGYFASQQEDRRAMQLRHARSLPLLLSQPQPPGIAPCDLAQLGMPAAVAWGAQSRALFKIVGRAAAACLSSRSCGEVPAVGHLWPEEDPGGFSRAVEAFLSQSFQR